MMRRLLVGALALGLVIGLGGPGYAAGKKLDKKLKKKAGRALGAAAALPETAGSDEAAISAAVEAIGEVAAANNGKAAEFLLKVGLGARFKCPAAEVAIFQACKEGLSKMDDPDARKSIYKYMKKRNWMIQIMLVEVVKDFNDDKSQFALHEILQNKKTDERVVAEVARTLGHRKDKRGVRPLISVFDNYKKRGGVTFKAIRDALYEITGKRFDDVRDWEGFWDPREQTFDPANAPKDPIGGTMERKRPKLFGSEVVSKRIVVIIDVSGSMAIKDPGEDKDEDAEEMEGSGSVARKKKPKKPTNAAPPYNGPPLQPNDPNYNKLPKERMRIERAKKQLRRLVKALKGDARFNIVKFSTAAAAWKPKKILPASPGNKNDAIKFIEALKPNGVTQAYKSLITAFECQEADTIYFISDGSPTDDSGNPLDSKGQQALLDKVSQLNKFRKVKVHTIGLRGSSPTFMQSLATLTGGKYKQVD